MTAPKCAPLTADSPGCQGPPKAASVVGRPLQPATISPQALADAVDQIEFAQMKNFVIFDAEIVFDIYKSRE
jgi:hypothetical protein